MADPKDTVQALLRILSTGARLPLATALKLVKPLHAADLTPETLGSAKPAAIQAAIAPALGETDDAPKLARQISAAAKRIAKAGPGSPPASRKRKRGDKDPDLPAATQTKPLLPTPNRDEAAIRETHIYTNRAPLLLAFATVLLKYTMPAQPEDSRLSLAQGMVSTGAKARARELGIAAAASKEEERLRGQAGQGFRRVNIMGGSIAVLRREGVETAAPSTEQSPSKAEGDERVLETQLEPAATLEPDTRAAGDSAPSTQATQPLIPSTPDTESALESEPAYWALDLDAAARQSAGTAPPIHTAASAASYLHRSFATSKDGQLVTSSAVVKTANLALLLGALELAFASWAGTLDAATLNARAWSWYVAVRPAVADGAAGWGGKGEVGLERILALRRA